MISCSHYVSEGIDSQASSKVHLTGALRRLESPRGVLPPSFNNSTDGLALSLCEVHSLCHGPMSNVHGSSLQTAASSRRDYRSCPHISYLACLEHIHSVLYLLQPSKTLILVFRTESNIEPHLQLSDRHVRTIASTLLDQREAVQESSRFDHRRDYTDVERIEALQACSTSSSSKCSNCEFIWNMLHGRGVTLRNAVF